jgi:flavorubredoxin
LDYIVSNHAEQDHSGSIPMVLEMFPETKVVTNVKCKDLLIELINISENRFEVINDKQRSTLSLGDKTLQFIAAPWVHWPETMLTFLQEDKTLFSCDLFGAHLATSNLLADEEGLVYREAKRYYAQIMMPYAKSVGRYIQIVESLEPELIAPSHGPVYRNPEFIINAHQTWISDSVENMVALFYVSMHGSTQKMVEFLCDALIKRDVKVKPFNLINADYGEIAMSLVDASTLIFGSPAFLVGPHPSVLHTANLVKSLKPKAKLK